MSLLIKALDHLDKNKQAEKSKKLTGEYVADDALMLELVPMESEPAELAAQSLKQSPEQSIVTAQTTKEPLTIADAFEITPEITAELASTENPLIDRVLSLEEEAGLTGAHIPASKYAKPKLGATKPTEAMGATGAKDKPLAQAGTLKNLSSTTLESSAKSSVDQLQKAPSLQNAATTQNQKAAAKVFVANKAVKAPSSKSALAILGVAGALLVWLGLQGYSYLKVLTAPDVVVVKPNVPIPSTPIQAPILTPSAEVAVVVPNDEAPVMQADSQVAADGKNNTDALSNRLAEKTKMFEDTIAAEPNGAESKLKSKKQNSEQTYLASEYLEPSAKTKRKPVTLTKKAPSSGIDPTLMAAYQAYTRGDDGAAQQQYRQVLQRDGHNVDALLGMAAIAQRQNRDADAAGWYQKVLEIEPKNTIALSAAVDENSNNSQDNADAVGAESRIKNMLAQHPEAANLHAALGNLYIAQNQWPSAQEAYFNASRLAPSNADYAFNLAISLDQMGKAQLALKQYERALELLNKSGASSPDRATLETRIRELQ